MMKDVADDVKFWYLDLSCRGPEFALLHHSWLLSSRIQFGHLVEPWWGIRNIFFGIIGVKYRLERRVGT